MATVSYIACFYFFSLTLKTVPLGVAYAVWGGLGIILTVLVSIFVFKQAIDIPSITGIILIVAGVFIINFFSKTIDH
jgi:small multidrug resistance pump